MENDAHRARTVLRMENCSVVRSGKLTLTSTKKMFILVVVGDKPLPQVSDPDLRDSLLSSGIEGLPG